MYIFFLSIQSGLLSFRGVITVFSYEELEKLKTSIGYNNSSEESNYMKYLLENS
jgi:hypothetical protein